MRTLVKIGLVLLILGGAGAAAYRPARNYWNERNRPKWRTAEVVRGNIVEVVNATGQVKPVLSVQVGAFVSGPIQDLPVEFNDEVEEGQLLARIDPKLYKAAVARDQAQVAIREAEVVRSEAVLEQARRDVARAEELRAKNPDFISQAEMDQLTYNCQSLEAQKTIASASVEQAKANLENSLVNLGYTEILSPVAGVVIDRKIDPGQTLAATFQTPQLFIVAPQMREKMHVHASVDEADIGLIRQAQQHAMQVLFTVDAYPDDLFQGQIEEIRYSSTTTQNVVTYPVIVAAANPDLKLLPGMTANLSFQVDQREEVVKIPNAALRFYPEVAHVRTEDHKILEGAGREEADDDVADLPISASERSEARRARNRRHVWILEGEKLKAVEVQVGLSDSRFTELVSGDLQAGQQLVTGIKKS